MTVQAYDQKALREALGLTYKDRLSQLWGQQGANDYYSVGKLLGVQATTVRSWDIGLTHMSLTTFHQALMRLAEVGSPTTTVAYILGFSDDPRKDDRKWEPAETLRSTYEERLKEISRQEKAKKKATA